MSYRENAIYANWNHRRRRTRNIVLICLAFLLALLVICPASAQQGKKYGKLYLSEYVAKSADEAAILDILVKYEKGFNSHDLQTLLSFFAKDAMYRPCGVSSHFPIGSAGCQGILKYNFGSFRFETYYDPEITVSGKEAVVKLLLETGDYLAHYKFVFKERWRELADSKQ